MGSKRRQFPCSPHLPVTRPAGGTERQFPHAGPVRRRSGAVSRRLFRQSGLLYLQSGDEKSELVSCYLVQRTQHTLSCRFSNPLPTAQIDATIAQKEMDLTIESLFTETREDLVNDFLGSFVS